MKEGRHPDMGMTDLVCGKTSHWGCLAGCKAESIKGAPCKRDGLCCLWGTNGSQEAAKPEIRRY